MAVVNDFEYRLGVIEANEKNIFHQLDEIKAENKAIRELAQSVGIIAAKTNQTASEVAKIGARLDEIEAVPTRNAITVKNAIISAAASAIVGGLLGAIMTLIIK